MFTPLFAGRVTRGVFFASLTVVFVAGAVLAYDAATSRPTPQAAVVPDATAEPTPDAAAFKHVDIDRFVAAERPIKEGTTSLLPPAPIRFVARVKQHPHPRKAEYLYRVLAFFPMDPRPEVNHRMFVTTPGGHIMPVYVEERTAAAIRDGLGEEGRRVAFHGYHMYNYSKGPAILVTGYSTDVGPRPPGADQSGGTTPGGTTR
ncbi:MAG: hypothetical protein U5S82_18645 [Gammaproteobacteria bacterium]|nr:hypothetical protein [Gammaproteobacteria bacterium]